MHLGWAKTSTRGMSSTFPAIVNVYGDWLKKKRLKKENSTCDSYGHPNTDTYALKVMRSVSTLNI